MYILSLNIKLNNYLQHRCTILAFFFILSLGITSCVDRISIPDNEDSKLVLNCEITRGHGEITATLSTSNNLNATSPITVPDNAEIKLTKNIDEAYFLTYDPVRNLYFNNNFIWTSEVGQLRLTANVPNSDFPEVTATAVPLQAVWIADNKISATPAEIVEIDGQSYFERVLTIETSEPVVKPAYMELHVTELLTTFELDENGEKVYISTGSKNNVEIVKVINGSAGMLQMEHRDGMLIDHSRLENNTFTIKVRSAYPITMDNQVFDKLNVMLYTVDKNYYNFNRAWSNTVSANNGQYTDPPIWNNNIKEGFGHFSVRTPFPHNFTFK